MLARCHYTNAINYHRYGGRGVTVCDRWLKFGNFLADMGRKPSPKHSIDRTDNEGNYEPGNCRWATAKEQCRNTRRNRTLTHDGKTMCMAAWAEKLGITWATLSWRIKHGWSPDRIFSSK